jgi:small subunit ribosomal protein S1
MEEFSPEKPTGDNQPESPVEEQEEDFAALFEASSERKDDRVQRDSKIAGTIVSIGDEWIFVDIGGKTEGVIAREELLDKSGQLDLNVGDQITAYVVSTKDGEIHLSVKMTSAASDEAIRGAFRSGVPVEGFVAAERKGGFTVNVLGKQAFCPFSQIDLQFVSSPDPYIGQRFTFRITEYSERGRNIVLSRRDILEEERLKKVAELKETLKPGDTITGTVQNLTNFGAFVDIGGVQGLIPMSELAWYRVQSVSDVLSTGESVTVRILDLDWDKNRISLSRKHTLEDPWTTVAQRYGEAQVFPGTVTRLANFGAFVQLEPGIEGLVHISNLGMGRRINHPSEVLNQGDSVNVKIISVDGDARRMGLELLRTETQDQEQEAAAPELNSGDIVDGVVDSVKDYGVFIGLPGGKSGLLHVSQIEDGRGGDLRKKFPLGSRLQAQVLTVDPASGKISLSVKTLSKKDEESDFKEFASSAKEGRATFGTLGDLLKNKFKG